MCGNSGADGNDSGEGYSLDDGQIVSIGGWVGLFVWFCFLYNVLELPFKASALYWFMGFLLAGTDVVRQTTSHIPIYSMIWAATPAPTQSIKTVWAFLRPRCCRYHNPRWWLKTSSQHALTKNICEGSKIWSIVTSIVSVSSSKPSSKEWASILSFMAFLLECHFHLVNRRRVGSCCRRLLVISIASI